MRIGVGGFQLPKINIGKALGGPLLNGIKNTLKNVAGDLFKSSFGAGGKNVQDLSRRPMELSPPTKLNAPRDPPELGLIRAAGQFDQASTRGLIAETMGPEAARMFDSLRPDQQKALAWQAAEQRMARINQLLTNMLQTLHEMSKAIIQNTRA